MTTTLRPTEPLRQTDDGGTSRAYEVCVNSRHAGSIELGTDPGFGPSAGVIRSLHIEEPDRRRGRGTVAALAAEEVLRGWGCTEILASVPVSGGAPADPVTAPALRMAAGLGYTERSANLVKDLPPEPPELPADVRSRPLKAAEYARWWAGAADRHARSWIARGAAPEASYAKALASEATLLPEGVGTPGVYLGVLLHEEAVAGSIWVARSTGAPGDPDAYVYDVVVAPDRRGQGFGRALMLLAERVALHSGATRLGLNVFAGNTPAIRLYASLGYTTTHRNFFKPLL